jgi:hypothetical protein
MNRPRSIFGNPLAMARPARPPREAQLVIAAAAVLRSEERGDCLQGVARRLAERVVAAALEELGRSDSFATALAELERSLAPSPVADLATDPEIDTAAEITRRRLDRYAARCCRQLSDREWEAETREIAAEAVATLANRYCRHLRRQNNYQRFA